MMVFYQNPTEHVSTGTKIASEIYIFEAVTTKVIYANESANFKVLTHWGRVRHICVGESTTFIGHTDVIIYPSTNYEVGSVNLC